MSKEKELQDELERYWGQLDRIEEGIVKNKHRIGAMGGQMERVERMLRWLVVMKMDNSMATVYADGIDNMPAEKLKDYITNGLVKRETWRDKHLPDISDILEGKE